MPKAPHTRHAVVGDENNADWIPEIFRGGLTVALPRTPAFLHAVLSPVTCPIRLNVSRNTVWKFRETVDDLLSGDVAQIRAELDDMAVGVLD